MNLNLPLLIRGDIRVCWDSEVFGVITSSILAHPKRKSMARFFPVIILPTLWTRQRSSKHWKPNENGLTRPSVPYREADTDGQGVRADAVQERCQPKPEGRSVWHRRNVGRRRKPRHKHNLRGRPHFLSRNTMYFTPSIIATVRRIMSTAIM